MTPLLVDDEVKAAIKQVVDYAEQHRIDIIELKRLIEEKTFVGDDPLRSLIIPYGFRCVFSIEEQSFGWTRHLSVSVVNVDGERYSQKKGRFPNERAVRMIMDEFGMTKPFESCHIYLDEAKVNGSINIIEPMGDIDELRRTSAVCEESQAHVDGHHEDRRHTADRRGNAQGTDPGNDHRSPD